jgi:hypothetical protein
MRVEGQGDEAYTLIELTRLPSSSIATEFYDEIVLNYRAPQLIVSSPYRPDSTVTYLKRIPRSMKILPDKSEEEEAAVEELDKNAIETAKTASTAVNGAAAVGMATSMAIIVKYFQVVDVLMNTLGKINVKLGPDAQRVIKMLEQLQFPTF